MKMSMAEHLESIADREGGFAFPREDSGTGHVVHQPGMTLKRHYLGIALGALVNARAHEFTALSQKQCAAETPADEAEAVWAQKKALFRQIALDADDIADAAVSVEFG